MNYKLIGSIFIVIVCSIDAQQSFHGVNKFLNNRNHNNKDFLRQDGHFNFDFHRNDDDSNEIESHRMEHSKKPLLSPLSKLLNVFKLTKNNNRNNNADNMTPNMRLCERKYAEYVKWIFPNEKDTLADANDSQFNGRTLADPGEYPHMCALGFPNNVNGNFDYKCGGSLISDKFVITAAHCANLNGQNPSRIRIGDVNLLANNTKPLIRNVAEVYIHPDYTTTSNYNDIALLKMDKEIWLNEHIRPIRLWTSRTIAFEAAYAMGYGSTAFAREPTNRLTVLTMSLVSNEKCNEEMPVLPETSCGIISSQICAQDFISNRDTCQGDSGGPLQLNLHGHRHHERVHYHLIGITSYGLYCRSGYPSVFTRVQFFLDWIEEIVWNQERQFTSLFD